MNYSTSAKMIDSKSNLNKLSFADFEQKQTRSLPTQYCTSILEINLGAIVRNYNTLQSICNTAHVYPVLKANAYGLGDIPIGVALHKAGCNAFFVAYIEEALILRAHMPNVTLYVLNGPYDDEWASICFVHSLTPVLNTYESIVSWHDFAKSRGTSLRTALHINTGMHRLGLSSADLKRVLETDFPYISWSLVMSHLTCSDDSSSPMNEKQRLFFNTLRHYFSGAKFSLANSHGILLGAEYHYDVVRPGRALYGPLFKDSENPLIPCITIKSKILQIQELNPGDSVGYNCTFITEKPMKIATLALGYADGLSRRLGEADAYAMINGQKAPFIGRVSMDLTTVNVTNISNINVGDHATLVGGCNNAMTLECIAEKIQTDSRDVLVTLGDRFNKVYTI
ncbi:MAG: alanine racemase [Pseudomonadota bacterium]